VDAYIGPAGRKEVESCIAFIQERRKRMQDFRAVKGSLGLLGVKKMQFEEKAYQKIFLDLLEAFGKAGLWEEGLALIGSWCFNVYTQVFDVDFYPIRTMDFDFGLRVPYSGPKTEIDQILRNLGFTPRIDMGYDKIDYELPGVGIVEVFVDKEKTSEFQKRVLRDQLGIHPAVLSYLKNITLPSLPAFFIHRLVTARFGEYRRGSYHDASKIRKDLKQAALVAKKIRFDRRLKKQLTALIHELSDDLRQKMQHGADGAREYIKAPDLTEEDVAHILALAQKP
jgi:hypothetical protein